MDDGGRYVLRVPDDTFTSEEVNMPNWRDEKGLVHATYRGYQFIEVRISSVQPQWAPLKTSSIATRVLCDMRVVGYSVVFKPKHKRKKRFPTRNGVTCFACVATPRSSRGL
jgi:hypothetical protein